MESDSRDARDTLALRISARIETTSSSGQTAERCAAIAQTQAIRDTTGQPSVIPPGQILQTLRPLADRQQIPAHRIALCETRSRHELGLMVRPQHRFAVSAG